MLRLLLCAALLLSVGPLAAQSVPAWARPGGADAPASSSPSFPGPPGFPAPPGTPQAPPGFPTAPGSPQAPPRLPSTPQSVPVDRGLALLALAGAAYGARRLRQ